MPRAFADVSALHLHAEHLTNAADEVVDQGRRFMRRALPDLAAKMQDEVPVLSGETRASITIEIDDDGMGGSVGPTNRGNRGEPIAFFIEYGLGSQAPDPFVLRTSRWAEKVMPDRISDELRDVL